VREDVYSHSSSKVSSTTRRTNAARSAIGVTFSEVFKSALEWANNARRGFRVVPKQSQPTPKLKLKKEAPMQAANRRRENQRPCARNSPHLQMRLRRKRSRRESLRLHSRAPETRKAPVSTEKCHCGRPLGHTGKHVGGKAAPAKPAPVVSVAPPVSTRVSLEVTEAQLNQFLVKLSLEDKQRLANYFLQSAE
jgi:hypothetical protein